MIRLKDLGYSYNRNNDVLRNITMNFEKGRIYGILGKNGVGKSTLLKIISGLLNPEGECRVDQFNPFDRKAEFLEQITFVPEVPYVEDLKVREVAKLIEPFYPDFDFLKLDELLEEFEIPVDNSLRKMSLGQQKKAVIALALANNTPYLLMDEPTNGLDIPSKAIFRRIMASHLTEGRMILISTHQVRDLENLIDSVVILDNHGCLLDRSIFDIEDKLAFRTLRPEDVPLYVEASLRGNKGVMIREKDDKEEGGNVDLELLFNAVIDKKEEIKQLFKN